MSTLADTIDHVDVYEQVFEPSSELDNLTSQQLQHTEDVQEVVLEEVSTEDVQEIVLQETSPEVYFVPEKKIHGNLAKPNQSEAEPNQSEAEPNQSEVEPNQHEVIGVEEVQDSGTFEEKIKIVEKVEEAAENSKETCEVNEDLEQSEEEIANEEKKKSENEEQVDEYIELVSLIRAANQLKDSAKPLVANKNFVHAIQMYHQCLELINGLIASSQKPGSDIRRFTILQRERMELTIMVFCNLSLCHFNSGQFEDSLKYSEEASKIDPMHLKAAYRRALALKKLGRIEKAFEEIKNARLIAIGQQKTDEQINREYTAIKELYQEKAAKEKADLTASRLYQAEAAAAAAKAALVEKNNMTASTIQNLSTFVSKNFEQKKKWTSPYFAIGSAFTSFLVLNRFIHAGFMSKSTLIATPIISLSTYGLLQAKTKTTKIVCGSLIAIIAAFFYKLSISVAKNTAQTLPMIKS